MDNVAWPVVAIAATLVLIYTHMVAFLLGMHREAEIERREADAAVAESRERQRRALEGRE
jgi:hypothetical protein